MINMESIYWRDKETVRCIAAIDTMLAIFMFAFYLIGGVFLNTIIIDIQKGLLSKFTLIVSSAAVWVGVFFITFHQMRTSYNLFIVTYQDALGPQVTIKKSQKWMRISFIVLGMVFIKIVYLSTGKSDVLPLVWVVCGLEIFIQVIGLYFVRESIDDLKQEIYILRKATATSSTKPFVPEIVVQEKNSVTEAQDA